MLSCRLVFFGFKVNPRTEKFDLKLAAVAMWIGRVTVYMFVFYFVIGFLTTIQSFDPDAPEEVTDALFIAAREQYKLHYLLAFCASAFIAWLEVRKTISEQ